MICGEESEMLLGRHPNAFLLLAQIAMRAKWKDCPITNLKKGEAWIGDYKAAGIKSPKAYRHAQKILERCGLAAFKGANKGTVATLTNSDVFSISPPVRGEQTDNQGAFKGPAQGEQGATNNTDILIHGENRTDDLFESGTEPARKKTKAKGTLEEIKAYAVELGMPPEDGEDCFDRWQGSGWKNAGKPIADWRATMRTWKRRGFLASQNGNVGAPSLPHGPFIPTTPEMQALAGLFGRAPDEAWTSEEAANFHRWSPKQEQIHIVQCFYELPLETIGPRCRRRDSLNKLLTYWNEALDEARTFFADHQELYKPTPHHSAA